MAVERECCRSRRGRENIVLVYFQQSRLRVKKKKKDSDEIIVIKIAVQLCL